MVELYVIIHEAVVKAEVILKSDARKILKEIEIIKKEKPFILIEGNPCELNKTMPPPSYDLNIKVCGAYKEGCCLSQLYTLRGRGYQAYFYEEACLSSFSRKED